MITRRRALASAGAAIFAGGGLSACGSAPSYEDVVQSVWTAQDPVGDVPVGYLVHYATLAANSHNTQPWLFESLANGLAIRPDLSRATPIADADNHHLYASLGCATENLVLAAKAAGIPVATAFEETGNGHIQIDLGRGNQDPDPLFDAILDRQCTRSDYEDREVPLADLKKLEAAANIEGCRVILIPDRKKREEARDLVLAANKMQVENPAFVEELKHWLRFNGSAAAEKRDGLYSACSGNPNLPTWFGNMIFGFAFTADAENERYGRQISSSSGLAVFVSDRDDAAHWVQAGRSYQRFALAATGLGIRHAFINQPLEVESQRPLFAGWLGLENQRPDLIVRYGYAEAMPRSLRRPVVDVIG